MSLRSLLPVVLLSLAMLGCRSDGGTTTTPPDSPSAGAETSPPAEPAEAGTLCGSRGLAPCADGQACIHPIEAACGETDAPGRCSVRPEMCTMDYSPVCGCDGRTYGNACGAHAAGVSIRAQGECP